MPGFGLLPAHEVEAGVVDVSVAAAVDDFAAVLADSSTWTSRSAR
jgi:hypothetical protein